MTLMLIVVEGCVGVGKSTVAKGLASTRGSQVLLERFEENPFLDLFYNNPLENAVETEFAFLLLHFHQLKPLTKISEPFEFIADFSLEKDWLYAKLNLEESTFLDVFRDLHGALAAKTPRPSLMICLTASDELVLSRIRKRNRPAEQQIDPSYYVHLNAAYSRFFAEYAGPKLFVSMDNIDFVKTPSNFRDLSSQVSALLTASNAS
jgi:deoxyadenosine/deoxycytidine kinase